jgi:hypothetical protein
MSKPKIPQIFKPEQFEVSYGSGGFKGMAEKAQQIFEQWLAEQKLVYGINSNATMQAGWYEYAKNDPNIAMLAYLVCVTPLEQKCVEHEPDYQQLALDEKYHGFAQTKCVHCKIKIKATAWSEA